MSDLIFSLTKDLYYLYYFEKTMSRPIFSLMTNLYHSENFTTWSAKHACRSACILLGSFFLRAYFDNTPMVAWRSRDGDIRDRGNCQSKC